MKRTIYSKGGHDTKAPEGAIAGIGAGGIFGGSLGLLAGIGLLAIPGLGPFIAAGPIVATLTGLAAGATVGGLTGALIGLGVPEEQAKQYETHIKSGGALIAVHAEKKEEQLRAQQLLAAIGASRVSLTPPDSTRAKSLRRGLSRSLGERASGQGLPLHYARGGAPEIAKGAKDAKGAKKTEKI